MALTRFQYEVLEGLMLGDGHLSIGGRSINARLRINRALRDKKYAQWIRNVFNPYCSEKALQEKEIYDERCGKTYQRISFCTLRHPDFKEAYQRWYPKGEKELPENLILTSVVIAIWLADDGGLYQRRKKGRTTTGVELSFATSSFGKKGSDFLANLLNDRYRGGFKTYGGYKGSRVYKVITSTRPARRLVADIDSFFPPLSRKSKFWRKRGILSAHMANPLCPKCEEDSVYKRGFYTGRGTIRLAQRFKCRICGYQWKEPLKDTP